MHPFLYDATDSEEKRKTYLCSGQNVDPIDKMIICSVSIKDYIFFQPKI